MTDFYRDTDHRYQHDVDFQHAVDFVMHLAQRHGFTPGELKQIAFKAALNLEMLTVRSVLVPTSVLRETELRTREELRRRGCE